MAGGDARLSPERMARVFGLAGPGPSPTPGRHPDAASPGGFHRLEARRWADPAESGDGSRDAAGGFPAGEEEGDWVSGGGWVPEQPGPERPGRVGRLLGHGRHRQPTTVRERLRVPAGLRGAVVRPSPRAVVGLAVVVLLATAVLGLRVWRADASTAPVEVAARPTGTPAALVSRSATPGTGGWGSGAASEPASVPGASGAGAPGSSTPAQAAGDPAHAAGTEVTVHVVGAVRRPGVIRVPAGSRLVDAVQRCGGTAPGADLTAVNLARVLTDGEQVVIPVVGARAPAGGRAGSGSGTPPAGASPENPAGPPSGASTSGGPVNLNTADAAALDTLPGVGPKIAERIIAWRTEHGRFSSVDELAEVDGIGDKLLSRLRPLVVV